MSNWVGRKVLVTGGAGFIGSQLVMRLADEGANVTVLDNLFTGRWQNLGLLRDHYEFALGTVCDPLCVHRLVTDAEVVFHLAVRNIIVSTSEPREDFDCNVGGTLNVLLAAREHGTRVVYTSSVSVYGQAEQLPITEETPVSLLSPYAVSKYAAECYCRLAYQQWGVPVTIMRLSNTYGPGQSPANCYCGVIGRFMDAARRGDWLPVCGDGSQTRDYVYVGDTVDGLLRAATTDAAIGRTIGLGTGNAYSVNAVANRVINSYRQGQVQHVPERDIDGIRQRVIDATLARELLGWSATVDLDEGLRRTRAWLEAERCGM